MRGHHAYVCRFKASSGLCGAHGRQAEWKERGHASIAVNQQGEARAQNAVAGGCLAALCLIASTAHAQFPAQITIVSGNNQSGPVNTTLPSPLVVSIDCTSPTVPPPCGTVSWTSSAPGDVFSPQVSGTSGPLTAATSSTVLTLGPTPGPRTVTATSGLPGSPSVTFVINGGTVTGAQQAATLGTLALLTTSVQTTNIGLRLASLRAGARGTSVSGLSLSTDDGSLPSGIVASLTGGGASADGGSILSRLGVFATARGSFGRQDETLREPAFDFHTLGITLGADYRFTEQLILGLAFGYLRTNSDLDAAAGDSRTNGYSLSGYTNYFITDRWYVDSIATFGWNAYHTERDIIGANATARGRTDGTQFAISTSTGYNFNTGPFTFGPTFGVNYIRAHIDGYEERGGEPFNVRIDGQTIESVTTALGGQAMYAISMGWGVLMPQLSFDWDHEYKGDSRTVTGTVVAAPATVTTVQTNRPDRNYFNLGVGVSATFRGGVSAFLRFDEVLGRENFTSHSFNLGVRFEL